MIIQHNMQAMNANRMLGKVVTSQSKSTEKLSSGYRINRAADDAAGLAISEKMRGQIRGLNRASLNAQDGISLIQTAEGALNESQSILQRMRELSVQAANETNTDDDRKNIQVEINQLTSEINRIGNTTEFNTKKLLKGVDKTAEVLSAEIETLKEGEAALVKGMASNFQVKEESVVAKASTVELKGAVSTTTGKASDIRVKKEGAEAGKASANVLGLKFEATGGGTALNGTSIVIKSAGAGTTTGADDAAVYNSTAATLTITLSEETINAIDTVSDLNSKIGELLKTGGSSPSGAITTIKTVIPQDAASEADISDKLQALVADTTRTETAALSGGTAATAGEYTFDLEEAFSEVGDTITIAGYTFEISAGSTTSPSANITAKLTTLTSALTDATTNGSTNGSVDTGSALSGKNTYEEKLAALKGMSEYSGGSPNSIFVGVVDAYEAALVAYNTALDAASNIRIGTTATPDLDTQGADIADALEFKLNDVYGAGTVDVTYANGKLTIKEESNKEGKLNLDTTVSTAGAGGDETLTITDEHGQNIQVEIAAAGALALSASYSPANGTDATGKITITLSTSAGDNTADAIQAKIRALSHTGVDFSKFTVKASDEWEDKTIGGGTLNKAWGTMAGGVKAVNGEYTFNVSEKLQAGETLKIGGQTFTAVEKDADDSKGEFIVGADMNEQLTSLTNAMRNNEALANYDINFDGAVIKLVEKNASGKDLDGSDLDVTATGIQGEFKVDTSELLKDGAALTIDGEKITVSSKNAHSGYANGTAIKEAGTAEEQAQALADAVNNNEKLSAKYTASVDGANLVLTQKFGEEGAPEVSTTSSTKGDFVLKLQIGANTGQSMTVTIGDTRANAIGVSGDGSVDTITASDGSVATYSKVANVNNGSDNNNVEYALDVSTFDNASAATAVIDDALNALSSQRAELGSFQNRLEYTITNLDNTSENLQSAESVIRDVDMAAEMVDFSKNNILQQAAQSMLAQANQANQGVLSLLR